MAEKKVIAVVGPYSAPVVDCGDEYPTGRTAPGSGFCRRKNANAEQITTGKPAARPTDCR